MNRIAAGAKKRARAAKGSIVVQLTEVSDPAAAAEALRVGRDAILRLSEGQMWDLGYGPDDPTGPSFVSDIIPSPSGPFILVDCADLDDRYVDWLLDTLSDRVAESGVQSIVTVPRLGGPITELFDIGPALVLRVLPAPTSGALGERLPTSWLAEAASWVADEAAGNLQALVVVVEFPLLVRDLPTLLRQCFEGDATCTVTSSGLPERFNACRVSTLVSQFALAFGGPTSTVESFEQAFAKMKALASASFPAAAYACVSFEVTFASFMNGLFYPDREGAADPTLIDELCDEYVLDAFPYQVLGPGHVARVGQDLSGSVALPNGRIGVEISELRHWMTPGAERQEVIEKGRRLLAPCLLSHEEAKRLRAERGRT